jgi:large subunit ribosomal protein L15
LKFSEVNLGGLQQAIDAGKLDANTLINVEALVAAGVVRRKLDGVRLLGNGVLKSKLQLEIAGASASAIKAVEAAGGTIKLLQPVKDAKEAEPRPKAKKPKAGK